MQTHAILHSDLNCFYASVETMLDPRLRGKAIAVCGSTEGRQGGGLSQQRNAAFIGSSNNCAQFAFELLTISGSTIISIVPTHGGKICHVNLMNTWKENS